MSTPWPTLGLVFLYVMLVTIGPKIMKNREPFGLKWILVVYNFGVVILSVYMLCEVRITID